MQEEYKRTDLYALRVLFLGFSVGFFLSLYFDKFYAWIIFGIYPIAFFGLSYYYRPGSLLTRTIAVFALISESYMMFSIADGSEFRTIFMILPFIMLIRYRDYATMLFIPFFILLFEAFFHLSYHFLEYKWVLDYSDPFSAKRQWAGYGILAAAFLFCLRISHIFKLMTEKAIFDRINLHERLKNLKENLLFAKELVKQNFDYDFRVQSINPLGEALLELRESLLKSREIERENSFKSSGLAKLGATLREQAFHLDSLCESTLHDLAAILRFQLGAFYLADFEEKVFKPCAGYGIPANKLPEFAFEEGLLGQSFKSGKMLMLDTLPENYIKINSYLGSSTKAHLIIVPIKNAGKPIGLLEIISFQPLKYFEIEFIETVSDIIGSVVDSTMSLQKSLNNAP
jgi:putative methionine-R-sulfoxide reductase with GAF domain